MKDIPTIDIVRVWIGRPFKDGHFNGTAFFIDGHTLVTAKHVVTNRDGKVYRQHFCDVKILNLDILIEQNIS